MNPQDSTTDTDPMARDYVTVSDAAKLLGVSIDTIRRWDKAGKLHAERLDGKNRYFAVDELEAFKATQPLSSTEVAAYLGVSPSTVRRLEQTGHLTPERDATGKRMYDRTTVGNYIEAVKRYNDEQNSTPNVTYVPQVDEKPLFNEAPQAQETPQVEDTYQNDLVPQLEYAPAYDEEPVAAADIQTTPSINQPRLQLPQVPRISNPLKGKSLRNLSRSAKIGLGIMGGAILFTGCLVILFLAFPKGMSKAFGYRDPSLTPKQYSQKPSVNPFLYPITPFGAAAHQIASLFNDDLRSTQTNASNTPVQDVGEVLSTDKDGNVITNYTLTFPDSTYLRIPDQGMIANLNAQFVQGHKPGNQPGDLAILPIGGSSIQGNTITSAQIADGTIQLSDLSTGAVAALRSGSSGGGTTYTSGSQGPKGDTGAPGPAGLQGPSGPQGPAGPAGIPGNYISEVIAGAGLNGGGNNGAVTLNVTTGSSTETINDAIEVKLSTNGSSTTTSSVSGLEVTSQGLRLVGGCTASQILKYNGTSWACSADNSAGSVGAKEGGTTITAAATAFNFSANDFDVTDTASQANVAIDYTNSGITRRTGTEIVTGNWSFNDSGLTLQDNADATKRVAFELSGITGGTTRTLDVPNVNGTLITSGNLTAINTVGTITSGVWQGSTLGVQYGGTGATTFTTNSLIYGNGSGALQSTAAGTAGQVLLANASGVPTFTSLSGDAAISSAGVVTLSASGVGNGTYGSATQVPVFTVDAKGRLTGVTNTTISGVAPGGSATGDLSGNYPNPTVSRINGSTLGDTTAAAGSLLVGSGTSWVSRAITGDLSVSSTGVVSIGADSVSLGTDTTGAYIASLGTLTGLTATGNSGEGSTPTLSVDYGSSANTAVQGNTSISVTSGTNLSGGGSITLGAGGSVTLNTVANPSFGTSVTTPLLTNNATLNINTTGATSDLVLGSGRNIVLTGFNCTTNDNGGVLTVDASGALKCDNDDGGAAGTITGSGTTNRIPLYTGTNSLSTSFLAQNGSSVEIDNTRNLNLLGGNLSVTGAVTASGTVTFSGLGAGLIQSSSGGVLSSGAVDRNSSTYFTNSLSVANGGTGAGSFTTNGIVYGNGTGALQVTGAGTGGQILMATATGVPAFTSLSGDVAINSTGVASVQADSVSLGTDTTGAYIASLGTLTGLTATGNSGEGSTPTLSVDYGSSANTAVQGNTSISVTSGTNLSGGGSITLGAGGSVTLNTVANPSFGTSVTTPLLTNNGALTVSTTGLSNDLSLISGSGTLNLTTNTVKTATSLAYDLTSAANTAFTFLNSGTGVTDVNLADGALQIGGTSVITSGRVLQNVTADTGILTSGTLGVTRGGTGVTSFTTNGLLYGNNGSAVQVTAAGTGGQLLLANAGGVPTFTSLSGDASLSAAGALTLANTTVSANTYGSATEVPVFSVDSKGRITGVTNTTITGASPTGAAGGDLTGNFPNPTLAKLQGATLTTSSVSGGNLLLYNGSAWVNQSVSGDLTIASTGVATIANNAVTTLKIADGNVTNAKLLNSSLTVTAGTGLSGGGSVSLGGSTSLSVLYGSSANTAAQGNTTFTCTAGTGNLSGGGATITIGTGGACGNIDISSSPSFATSVTTPSLQTNGILSLTTNATVASDDIILNSAGSEVVRFQEDGQIKFEKGANDAYFSIAAPSGAPATYTFSGVSGTVLTTANFSSNLDSTYVNTSESPAAGDINGSFSTGLNVGADSVALGTDTTGAYISTLGTLTGLSTTGNSGEGSNPTLSVLYGSSANTAVQGNTTITCASGSGNLTGGGSSITLGTGGSCGAISTNNDVSFTTAVRSPLITNAGALTLSTTGSNDLTITSGSSTLNLNATTLKTAASQTFDLFNAGATSLTVTNSGAGTASLAVEGDASFGGNVAGGTYNNATISGGALSSAAVNGLSVSGGTITVGVWNGTALTDAYVSDTLTASNFAGSGSTTTAVDLATAEVAGNLRATSLQNSASDLGAANVNIDLTNTNGSFVTNLTLDGTITAATFSGALSGNASTSTALAANPSDCSANQFANAIAANGNLTCAALTDGDIPDSITINNSTNATNATNLLGSGSTTNAVDLATAEVAGNLRANNLQSAGADLGAANVNIDLSNTNGAFNTNLTLDGTITASSFSGALTGNAATASALAANPTDCSANQFANAIDASGNLSCAALTDADIPNTITIDLASAATALAANPTDCSANQFANAIAANGNLTCANITDADVSNTLTASIFVGSGSSTDAVDLATAEIAGNLRATNIQSAGADLGAANVNIDLSNTNSGGYVTNLTLDGTVTAATFSGALSGNASTATALAANPSDCSANQFANAIAASGNLTCAGITDADVSDTLTASLFVGSGSTTTAIDLATAEVAGNLRATNLQAAATDLGAANVNIDLSNTNGSFVTNLTLDGTITASSFSGALTGNASTATALAANPTDCSANQFTNAIDASGNLSCAALTDADVPNNITIDLAAAATNLAANPSDCSANQFANAIAANGNLTCASITDADVSDTLTASIFVGSGSSTNAVDLATAEVAGNLRATNLQNSASDLGAANVNVDLSNTNSGGYVTNLTLDGTVTAATFSGALSGNASTATALAANPSDCSANQFANAIAASGNLTCAGITDADVSDTLTASLFVGSGSTTTAIDLATAEVAGNLRATNLQAAATDLGAANVNIDLSNTNGSFVTNLTLDGTITASSFSGALTGNASTATALAANPTDCSANQFTNAIDASGNLSCAALTDADVPNNITIDLAAAATNLAANPSDCSANQFANAIAANGNLTCASITDADVSDTLTASIFVGSGSSTDAVDLATAEVAGNLRATNIQNAGTDLGGANVNIDLSNTNSGGYVTNLTLDGTVTAATFSGALTGNASTATALAANPTDCSANQFATAIAASGNLTCAALTDGDIPDSITVTNSTNATNATNLLGSGSTSNAVDLATAEVAGNLRANNLQSAGADLGAANVTIDLSNTNGAFNTSLTLDGTITASSFSGALTGNASTATALAANPTDCSANQFANAIDASGNLNCAALVDADIPNNITVDLAAAATALASDPSDCAANQFATTIAANGNLTCASITDADVSNTLTASIFVGSGSSTDAVDLATAEVAGNLRATNIQNAGTDLGGANVNIDLSNTNSGGYVTNLTLDGTVTAATFSGALTGNASTATALAANPTDCSANQFATAIAASGNLTCAALTDGDIPDSITVTNSTNATNATNLLGSGSTSNAVDLATAEVAGNLRANNLQSAGADLGAANVTIDLSNTNGAFNTSLTLDGTITASSFSGALTGNASTATALAANPTDCSANQFANAIDASGNLNCAALVDADIPNNITVDLAAAATALASDPSDCAANQFATTIAANGNLTCASITDADVSNTLTASIFVGSGSSTDAVDLATAEVAGNLRATNIQNAGTDLGGANVNIDLSNTNSGGYVTNLTLDGTVTAATFSGALTGNASTATALAANPTDCSANQFATAIAASGNLTCAALTDGDIPDSITVTNSTNATNATNLLGSGSTSNAVDLATAEVAGNLRANNLQSAGADLGAANVTIDLSNTNGAFNTSLTLDGTITASSFSGALTGNASTATALAANPTDCSANQFANAIDASGNLNCAALVDADIPNNITVDLAAAATALASDPSDCAANQFATTIAANGNLTCASITDADVSNTLTASIFVGSGSSTDAVDLATAEVAGNLRATNIQNAGTDLGGANVNIDLSNTNSGGYVTNLTLDGTVTAATFSGALTGNASTATALAANPTDCSANQFATAIAASGNLTCAALTDGDIPDSITVTNSTNATNATNLLGSGSTSNAVDLATAEVAGNLRANNLQSAGADLGAANVTIDLSNTNGAFNTSLTLDGTITASSFSGALTGNASTATALAANPTDCSANQFANAIDASGNLNCAALVDADIPNNITVDLAAAATALASDPSDCAANQFATTIAANGNLTCASITDADVSNTLTASIFVGSGSSTDAVDLATAEVAGNLRATNIQNAGTDLGGANVNIDLSNTNSGGYVTNLTLDGTVTAATFSGALTGNASTATALAANPTDCSANQFATAIAASGNLTCAALTDGDIPDSITVTNSTNATNATNLLGSGSTSNAVDLATAEVAGNLRANNLQSAGADLGAANVTIDLSNTNGAFNTSLTLDGTITASSFSGALTGNASTATALAANPTDCSANQFANAIDASGNLNCAALVDADIPNNITVDLAAAATALASDPSDCAANQFATTIAANGNLTCASITDADVSNTLTASIFVGSGSSTDAVDLATAEVAGNLRATNIQNAGTDLGGANVNIDLSNTNSGGYVTNLTLDGTVTAATFSGALTGNASTATALAANPTDCSANQFATAIAASGNLTCAALTDGDIPDSITVTNSTNATNATNLLGSGSTSNAVDLATAEVAGNLRANNLQSAGADLGAANVTIDLSNTNGAFNTSLTLDGTITASSFSGALTGNASTATALAANPTDCSANQFANAIDASGNLNCAALVDADIPNNITVDLAAAATALASDPSDCAANQFATTIAANGNLTCASITDADVSNTLTASIFVGSGSSTDAVDLATAEVAGNLRATNIQNAGTDLGGANVNIDLSNTNSGGYVTNLTLDGTVTAATFSGALTGNASTATALAANPTDCSANQFATAIAASGNLTCAALTDGDIPDSITVTNSTNATNATNLLGSGSTSNAVDLATAEVAGNLRANNLQSAGADLGAANVTIDLSNTNGAFNTSLTLDGTITASSFSGALTGNASTATALAANPTDCSANQFANAIDASGNLNCAALVDADIPNNITVDLAAAATALASDPSDCAANQFATTIAANGNLTCASITDADVSNTLTASIFVGSGSSTDAVDLATAEVAGNLKGTNLQSAGSDLGAANVNIDFSNTNGGGFVTNLTVDGTITTSGTIGTASTTTFTGAGATFSSAIAANGGVTLGSNQNITTTAGTGSLLLNSTVTNASDDAILISPSYTGGVTDNLTYNGVSLADFSPTNASGTDTINGIRLGNLTDPGATITSNAINIGSGWDAIFNNNGTLISSTELNLLDGHDVAIVDTNDAVATAITGTGALDAGSITSNFGAINVGADTITTSGTIGTAGSTTFTGAGGTFSAAVAANGGITFDNASDTLGAHTLSGTVDANANILTNIGNTGTDFIASTGALTLAGVLTANGGVTLGANQDFTTTAGTGSILVNNTVTNASDDAILITPSYTGGATDTLTYNAISVAAFIPTNASGTDTVNGLKLGAMTDPGATITSNAINIGSGWDAIFNNNGTLISSTELNLLDGHDVAIVDTNDAVATAITGTGALDAGSITSNFGAINVGADTITTSGTIGTAGSTTFTGAGGTFSAAVAANGGITSTQAAFVINASGAVDIQDALTADSLISDAGVSVAAGQSYTGAGAVILSSAGGSNLTLDSGSTGTIAIGTDASAESITIGSGNAVKTIQIGLGTSGNTIQIGTNNTTLDTISIGSALDTLTFTGSNSSTFVLNAITVTATEFNRLDGKDVALVDQNDFTSGDGAGVTSTGSGMEAGTGGIGLLQGCANNEILKWVDGTSVWSCAVDATVSDGRLKKDVASVDSALETLNQLRPVSYKYNELYHEVANGTEGDIGTHYGFIAQELQAILPDLVDNRYGVGEYLGVDYQSFTSLLTSAVQELDQKTTDLEGKVSQHLDDNGDADLRNIKAQTVDVSAIITNYVATPYRIAEPVANGDVVVADDQGLLHKSTSSSQKGLVGVVADASGFTANGTVAVASAGKVTVNVNGPVAAGDPLTSSSITGMAAKATASGQILGTAASSFNGAGQGQVTMIIGAGYFGGDGSNVSALQTQVDALQTQVDQNQSIDLSNLTVGTFTVDLDAFVKGSLAVTGQAQFSGEAIFSNLATFAKPVVFNDDVIFNGNVAFNNNTGGYARIGTGKQTVHVAFTKPYSQPPVLSVTMGNGSFAKYSYQNVTADGFDIILELPAAQELNFSWIALNVNGANTFVQQ